ncbi:helix-turn-helix domain-containing protein [Enterococcus sp. DIV0187]|uniref:helix-turn-helix domain-containing protein n=1 Tax=Enterococcus sp. DIV0187 TaxID=2774644 RepID=UPI003F683248
MIKEEVNVMIENFGANVTRLRKDRGLSQEELADKLGMKKQSISNIERGNRYPTFETLERIASVLNASPIQLFGTLKEIAVSDVPVVLDRIDEYDERVRQIFQAERTLKDIGESVNKLSSNIKYIEHFFFNRPHATDKEGAALVDEQGNFVFLDPLFESLPFDSMDSLVKQIQYIEQFCFPKVEYNEGDPVFDDKYNVLTSTAVEKVPFDKIDETYHQLKFILENREKL